LSEIKIKSTIQRGELNAIKVNDLNTNACRIDFKSPIAKHVKLHITNKLGVKGDHMKMSINIPTQANKSFSLNIKSGMAGIEVINKGVQTNIPVQFNGVINGKRIAKNFTIPFKNTMRIKPSTMVNTNSLLVSRISHLFGTVKKTHIIKSD
jgi:hypothetical protein